jgi:chemotaxis-related protein WspB
LKRVPLAHAAVAGLMNLYGRPVPVIDLACMAGYGASASHYDTRIVVANYHAPDGAIHALGLLAERVQGVQDIDAASLHEPGVRAAPFLGQVGSGGTTDGETSGGNGMVQLVEVGRLLPADLRAALFPDQQEAAS